MKFHVLTLFPEMIEQSMGHSMIGRAQDKELLTIDAINIRDFSTNKHKRVDDYPYGGGSGLLMGPQAIYDAYQSLVPKLAAATPVVYLTPRGKVFDQSMAKRYASCEEMVLLCGHYEGVDERVLELIGAEYVSIGDYVLTGGELAAMCIIDAVGRLVPEVLHNEHSTEDESFEGDLLEYPQYTRPAEFMGKTVPQILLSGDHAKVDAYRREQAERETRLRRPDLWERYCKAKAEKEEHGR